jgi:RimJ/RimL family protein N-acetyltransferase
VKTSERFDRLQTERLIMRRWQESDRAPFADLNALPEIWSMTAVLNEPSRAVMRRLGLTETTRFDHPRIPPGDPLRPQVAYLRTP